MTVMTNGPQIQGQPSPPVADKKILADIYVVKQVLKEDVKGNVYRCYFWKGLFNFGKAVVKEASRHSVDEWGRPYLHKLHWQKKMHERLQGTLAVPGLLDWQETATDAFLVIENIKGISLVDFWAEHKDQLKTELFSGGDLAREFLKYIRQAIVLIGSMHDLGYVHRDATPGNFMIDRKGKVWVIDMELTYSMNDEFPSPPFALGSPGYTSIEQAELKTPTPKEDIFALGGLLMRLMVGMDPVKVVGVPYPIMQERVAFLIDDSELSQVILQCWHPDPDKRPQIQDILVVIDKYAADLMAGMKRKKNPLPNPFSREQIVDAATRGLQALCSPLMADNEGWFSEDLSTFQKNREAAVKNYLPFVFAGAAGPLYTLSVGKMAGFDVPDIEDLAEKSLQLFQSHVTTDTGHAAQGLYFGSSGMVLAAAAALRSHLFENKKSLVATFLNSYSVADNPLDSILNGKAGEGCAYIAYQELTGDSRFEGPLKSFVQYFIENQQADGSWASLRYGGKLTVPSFAQGMAGVVYFLLSYAETTGNRYALMAGNNGLEWLIKKGVKKADTMVWKSYESSDMVRWWGEGSIGIAMAFTKGYQLTKDARLKEAAEAALNYHRPYSFDRSLGQAHGLAGLGECYLEAYQAFGDEQWLDKAGFVAQTMMHLMKATENNGIYWTIQMEGDPSADFMIGNSGIVHFLMRCCFPDLIGFPFLSPLRKLQTMDVASQNGHFIYQNGDSDE